MVGSTVTFLFLVEIGAGTLLTLWLLRRMDISRALRQMLACLSGALVAVGLPFGMKALGQGPEAAARFLEAPLAWPLLLIGGCAAYVVSLSLLRVDWSDWILSCAALAGVASVVAGALAVRADPGLTQGLARSAYFLSATLLLGSVLGTMIVGHWYLVDHKMVIDPLRLASTLVLAAVVLRIAVVAVPGVRFWVALAGAGQDGGVESMGLILFWLQRALFGLAGPLALALMVRRTVTLRATQAATGLLYVVLIFVIAGESLSHYLFLKTDRFL